MKAIGTHDMTQLLAAVTQPTGQPASQLALDIVVDLAVLEVRLVSR